MLGINNIKVDRLTTKELGAMMLENLKPGDFLIHRGEICRVAFTSDFQLEAYSDQHPDNQKEWRKLLGINVAKQE